MHVLNAKNIKKIIMPEWEYCYPQSFVYHVSSHTSLLYSELICLLIQYMSGHLSININYPY